MKVVVIGPSLDGTGYSHSQHGIMQALDSAGVDVVDLWITLSMNPRKERPQNIKHLECKNLDNVDAVIQYILPQHYVKIDDIPCVGIHMYETSHFRGSNWQYACNMMDEIWAFNLEHVEACKNSGVKTKIREIDYAHDPAKFARTYSPLISELSDRFVFYTISELSYRKNILGLLTAYYNEFSLRDNVALVLKLFKDGGTNKDCEEEFDSLLSAVKKSIKKGPAYRWPPVVLIANWLSEVQMNMLHCGGDCYITLSKGECENIPLYDAVCFGNYSIAPDWHGPRKLLYDFPEHHLVNGHFQPVMGMAHTMPHLYLSDEEWFNPDVIEAGRIMRKVYKEGKQGKNKLKDAAIRMREKFDYKKVGKQLKQHLEELIGATNEQSGQFRGAKNKSQTKKKTKGVIVPNT